MLVNISEKNISAFHKKIFSWWRTNKRDLPWRHTHDPYRILVSEIMLQQTQVPRVLLKYNEFLRIFPNITVLASSPLAAVLQVWKGLGYNRRAKYLRQLVQILQKKYAGEFPKTEKELLELPGIGLYTARAIQVFAWKRDVAMVDTNVRRIIVHYFFDDTPQSEKIIQQTADSLVPHGKSWEWHQALMDYGSLVMPTIVNRISKKITASPSVIAFKDTNRFMRGRIIDVLRDRQYTKKQLIDMFVISYNKSEDFIENQLSALVKEELVEYVSGDIIRLSQS